VKQYRFVRLLILVSALVFLIGCAAQPQAADSKDEAIPDISGVVDSLEEAGAMVEPGGSVSQPFFTPPGQIISVDGHDVQAFEFASATEADTAASTVAADGSSVGTSMMTWISTPHFYGSGNLIVLYVGDESATINVLVDVLGSQFAGG
jgi:hypothetical protein